MRGESSAVEPEVAARAVEPPVSVNAMEPAATGEAMNPVGGDRDAAGKGGVPAEWRAVGNKGHEGHAKLGMTLPHRESTAVGHTVRAS